MIGKFLFKIGTIILVIGVIFGGYLWAESLKATDPLMYSFVSYYEMLGLTVGLVIVAILVSDIVKKLSD